jgi:hypothetical protein
MHIIAKVKKGAYLLRHDYNIDVYFKKTLVTSLPTAYGVQYVELYLYSRALPGMYMYYMRDAYRVSV